MRVPCPAFTTVGLDLAEYTTADFLLGWDVFLGVYGVPRRVHSDRGNQLFSAAEEV